MSGTSLLFLLTYIAGLISSLIINGAWSFYVYQIVYFSNPLSRWWGTQIPDLPYSFVTVLFMGICWLYASFVLGVKNAVFKVPITKWLVIITLLYCVVQFYAIAKDYHWIAVVDYIKLVAVLFLAYNLIDTPKKLEIAIWMYLIGCTYIGWEAYSVGRNADGRVEGIGTVDSPDANGFAAAIAPAVCFVLYFIAIAPMRYKILAAIMGVWIVNGLVLINSRGAFLGVVAGCGLLLFYLLFSVSQSTKQRLLALCIVLGGLGGALYLTDDVFWERMNTLTELEDESKSGSHRYRMWLSAIDLAEDYPGGVGARGFQTLSPIYVDPSLFSRGQTQKAVHSSWFQVLSELGWLGFFCFLLMIFSCFKTVRRTRVVLASRDDMKPYFLIVAVEGAFITYLVSGTFIDQARAQILYWMILFIACAYNIYVVKNMGIEKSADNDGAEDEPVAQEGKFRKQSVA